MILLPIGRDESEIRRHAWISYAIIALNVLVFVATSTAERTSNVTAIQLKWEKALAYLIEHPYLQTPAAMKEVLRPAGVQQLAVRRRDATRPAPDVAERQQKELNDLVMSASAAVDRLPTLRFGFRPAQGGMVPLFASMFIHAGFMHLFGNLLFFFLSGPFVEDVFGRPLFAALYLAGGITASMTYAFRHPDATVPLVGASGAIAAVMGAYLVRFFSSKVEFLFVPILLRPQWHFRFFVPAFVVLPLWFAQQFLEMNSEAGSGGVAFSAHVGGFIFGAAIALVVKFANFEQKFVDPVVAQQTTWAMDARLVRAIAARNAQDWKTAARELSSVLRDEPTNADALRTAVDVASGAGDAGMLDSCATRLLHLYAGEKQNELASDLIDEVLADRSTKLPKFLARAAMFADRNGDRDRALVTYERLLDADPDGPAALPSLIKLGTLRRQAGDVRGAREMFARARAHPACNDEWAPTIDAKLAQLDVLA